MDYKKHYEALCKSRKSLLRTKQDGVYYEMHHIIPKSLGGTDDKNNLVLLTPKEHYIAHLLLYFQYKQIGGPALRKMAFALVGMAANRNYTRSSITSRIYSNLREAARLSRLGHKVENTDKYKKPKSDSHKEAIRQARLQAPPRSLETREKLRISAQNRTDIFPNNYIKDTCPHCGKSGQKNAMIRWHFKNCKQRKEVINA